MGMYILTREQQERKRIAENDLYDLFAAQFGRSFGGIRYDATEKTELITYTVDGEDYTVSTYGDSLLYMAADVINSAKTK